MRVACIPTPCGVPVEREKSPGVSPGSFFSRQAAWADNGLVRPRLRDGLQDYEKVSTAAFTRAEIGAKACSATFSECSVSLPLSLIAFSM